VGIAAEAIGMAGAANRAEMDAIKVLRFICEDMVTVLGGFEGESLYDFLFAEQSRRVRSMFH
jgi:hypothetical protein